MAGVPALGEAKPEGSGPQILALPLWAGTEDAGG